MRAVTDLELAGQMADTAARDPILARYYSELRGLNDFAVCVRRQQAGIREELLAELASREAAGQGLTDATALVRYLIGALDASLA